MVQNYVHLGLIYLYADSWDQLEWDWWCILLTLQNRNTVKKYQKVCYLQHHHSEKKTSATKKRVSTAKTCKSNMWCAFVMDWKKKNTPAHKITSCQICRYKSVSVCIWSEHSSAVQRRAARHSAGIRPWRSHPDSCGKKRLCLCVCVCVCVCMCVCVCVFKKKSRSCIVISNWVNVADCVCIQGCHGLAGFSFNPHTHPESSPADLALFQSIRPPGEEALFTRQTSHHV